MVPVALVQRAEELGYDLVWSGRSLRFRRNHAARVPRRQDQPHQASVPASCSSPRERRANAAMSAASIDAMAGGGRFIAGLGVSGPQIVEGWYGQPWGKPYYRVKDYVAIMRKIFQARRRP